MDRFERMERDRLPEEYRPLGAWKYFGYEILFAIPIVGFIFLLVYSFNGSNINRRSFARSYFCKFLIALIVIGALVGLAFALGLQEGLWDKIREFFQSL